MGIALARELGQYEVNIVVCPSEFTNYSSSNRSCANCFEWKAGKRQTYHFCFENEHGGQVTLQGREG